MLFGRPLLSIPFQSQCNSSSFVCATWNPKTSRPTSAKLQYGTSANKPQNPNTNHAPPIFKGLCFFLPVQTSKTWWTVFFHRTAKTRKAKRPGCSPPQEQAPSILSGLYFRLSVVVFLCFSFFRLVFFPVVLRCVLFSLLAVFSVLVSFSVFVGDDHVNRRDVFVFSPCCFLVWKKECRRPSFDDLWVPFVVGFNGFRKPSFCWEPGWMDLWKRHAVLVSLSFSFLGEEGFSGVVFFDLGEVLPQAPNMYLQPQKLTSNPNKPSPLC